MALNYQERIRALPCLSCGRVPSECAHIRFSDFKAGKVNPGLGAKPEDRWCVPLCSVCHRGRGGQHTRGERQWWDDKKIDPHAIARDLWDARDDYELQLKVIRHAYFHS